MRVTVAQCTNDVWPNKGGDWRQRLRSLSMFIGDRRVGTQCYHEQQSMEEDVRRDRQCCKRQAAESVAVVGYDHRSVGPTDVMHDIHAQLRFFASFSSCITAQFSWQLR